MDCVTYCIDVSGISFFPAMDNQSANAILVTYVGYVFSRCCYHYYFSDLKDEAW